MSNDNTTDNSDTVTSLGWRGITFTFPVDMDEWPADAVEAFEQGQAMSAVHALLGDRQWQAVKRVSKRTVGDVSDLAAEIAKAAGFTSLGE